MNTPICDFVETYANSDTLRLHMPGHKGMPLLGMERLDITEIAGADVLYSANGIIAESRENARKLFDTYATFYATEGSSLCIRAMVYLAVQHGTNLGKKPHILAARNAHKSFMHAVAMLDVNVTWLYPTNTTDLLSCNLSAEEVDTALSAMVEKPTALYLTSPDYLGNLADVAGIGAVCRRHGVLLMVDNAHGAYLRFLPTSLHPISLGADICCDSAHKTLPVLTGGAYLHIAKGAPQILVELAETALSIFASTSPSYLILQSLDRTNVYLHEGYAGRLAAFIRQVTELKSELQVHGYTLTGDEPIKLTLLPKAYGYTGEALAAILAKQSITWEFADADHLVLMLTPEIGKSGLEKLRETLLAVPQKAAIESCPPLPPRSIKVLSIRQALLSPSVEIDIADALGKVLACANIACPPAVPIVVCGERINRAALECLSYYNVSRVRVVK